VFCNGHRVIVRFTLAYTWLHLTAHAVFAASYEKIFEGHENIEEDKDPLQETRNGSGQRLQRQGDAWRKELKAWIRKKKRDPKHVARVKLGCAILIEYSDLLRDKLLQCNSEVDRAVPAQAGQHRSLLLSVTDPALPVQPGSEVRYWFPEDRQCKQPPRDQASLQCLPPPLGNSQALNVLLTRNSVDELKELVEQLDITPRGKMNRLGMAESIVRNRPQSDSRLRSTKQHKGSGTGPQLKGRVLSADDCRAV